MASYIPNVCLIRHRRLLSATALGFGGEPYQIAACDLSAAPHLCVGVAVAFGESWLIANGVSAPKDFSWYRPA
jgi:hypothetical protein